MITANRKLLEASYKGVVNAVDNAISEGADLDHIDENGNTALVLAASNDQANTVEHLLNRGANPNLGLSPPLCVASAKGFVDMVRLLVTHNATNVNARNYNNFTALHDAAEQGNVEVVRILLKNGANVNSHGNGNITPLHFAAQNNHAAVATMLLKNGARIDVVSVQGETPQDTAERKGHRDIIELLTQNHMGTSSANTSSGTKQPSVAEYQNLEVLDVDWDDDCIKYVYQQRCDCGRFWTLKYYNRSKGKDVIECYCPECNLTREYAFRPRKIHISVTELLQINRQYVRT